MIAPVIAVALEKMAQAEAERAAAKMLRQPAAAESLGVAQHVEHKTLHRIRKDDKERLACGRRMTALFRAVDMPSFRYPKCIICFGTERLG